MAFALCEEAARLLAGLPLLALRLPPEPLFAASSARRLELPALPAPPPDVDPAWFSESPPALPNRGPVDPVLAARVQLAPRVGIPPFDLLYLWNRRFVEENGCRPSSPFRKYPPPLLVFDPPEPSDQPVFRYPPSRTLPGGLVTNRYGWRGPDIPFDKPPGTVRIAFVGASTTVGLWNIPFSYPEFVVYWLNRWAQRAGVPVHFDGINAGREGITSTAIAAIVRQEVLPAEPDLIVYYEGGNQSLCTLGRPRPAPPLPPSSRVIALVNSVVSATRDYSALARRLGVAARIAAVNGGREPAKPPASLGWPEDLDERAPDITRPDLPIQLPVILGDLDSIRTAVAAEGGELAVSSYVWLVAPGLQLDPLREVPIYRALNEGCWPYRYADIRRAIDLHNRVLERYAEAHQLPFLDVARAFPMESALFFDSVHLNAEGTRVHGWLAFEAILPIVRAKLASGEWPRPDRVPGQSTIGPGRPVALPCLAAGG
ncbi:MAG TPA: SGNH/GDSL hydrolase family protein [Candidatus Binatia bacterium]|nr:SGNH/GDSL hydrolase family protein [Candidatus Binatia bacterium]